jgi:hypothetical protein
VVGAKGAKLDGGRRKGRLIRFWLGVGLQQGVAVLLKLPRSRKS